MLAKLLADTQAELVRTAAAAAMWQTRAQHLGELLEDRPADDTQLAA